MGLWKVIKGNKVFPRQASHVSLPVPARDLLTSTRQRAEEA